MPLELEDRLERVADTLPAPTTDSRDRALSAALAAVAAAPRRRRRRVLFFAPAVAGAVVVAVAAILATPWRDSPLATERALAALGHQPVVHAILEHRQPHESVVDLTSGAERHEAHRIEYWYDDERDVLRARLSVGGKVLPGGEYLHTPEGFFTDRGVERDGIRPPRLSPALDQFARGYREALESGDAEVVGEEVVDGREAIILRFPLPPGPSGEERHEEVAVDAEDYRPLRVRFSSTPWSEASRVVEIETIPRDPGDFVPPQRPPAEPRPAGGTSVDERELEPAEAAAALGRPIFWPGRAVAGVELTKIELMRVKTTWTDGRVTKGRALAFQYGADPRTAHLEGAPSLVVTVATYASGGLRFFRSPGALEQGELRLTGAGRAPDGDAEMWFGSMEREGVHLDLESKRRDLILAAAKAMVPLG